MALIEAEPIHPTRTLLVIGIPSFLLSVLISAVTHQFAHIFIGNSMCGSSLITPAVELMGEHAGTAPCALGSLAGPVWTFGLGLTFFALMIRSPHNLFFAAMAFVNSTIRLPETLSVFVTLLINDTPKAGVDEGASLALLRLHDQTIPTVIMCFYSIILLFFSIIVVHDIRRVPYKWAVAIALFLLLGFVEEAVWSLVIPLFS